MPNYSCNLESTDACEEIILGPKPMVRHNEWVFQEREGRLDPCGAEICLDDVGRWEAAVRT